MSTEVSGQELLQKCDAARVERQTTFASLFIFVFHPGNPFHQAGTSTFWGEE